MAIKVTFQHPKTGELKQVKIGFSWTLFFFATVLGIPLFMRKLTGLGFLALIICLANAILPELDADRDVRRLVSILTFNAAFGMNVWVAITGNEKTAKRLLERGWVFAHPHSPEAKLARQKWRLPELSAAAPAAPARA